MADIVTNPADIAKMTKGQTGELMNSIETEMRSINDKQVESQNATPEEISALSNLSTAYKAAQARHKECEAEEQRAKDTLAETQSILAQHSQQRAMAPNLAQFTQQPQGAEYRSFGDMAAQDTDVLNHFKSGTRGELVKLYDVRSLRRGQQRTAGTVDTGKLAGTVAGDDPRVVFAPNSSFNTSVLNAVRVELATEHIIPWFLENSSSEDGTAYVAESGTKPASDVEFTAKTTTLVSIAQLVGFTEHAALFYPKRLQAALDKAETWVDKKIAAKIFTAVTGTEGFDGFGASGVITPTTTTDGSTSITSSHGMQERILFGISYLMNSGDTAPDYVGYNPVTYYAYYADWLAQTAQNGGGQPPTLGLPYFLQSNITAGDTMVGNFKEFSTLYINDKIGTVIGYQSGDFATNKRTARMEKFMAFAIERATAFTFVRNA